MKTIVNKTHGSLKVPLPRGKTLRLGLGQVGQIADEHLEHKPLKRLIEAGKIELQGTGSTKGAYRDRGRSPHESTRGRKVPATSQGKGDR